jgi:hypothetical protein
MVSEVHNYNVLASGQLFTIPVVYEVAPGLLVYRIPEGMHPHSPHRWRLQHDRSKRAVADMMTREDAFKAAELFGALADWTQDQETLVASVDPQELFDKAAGYYPVHPADPAHRIGVDASRNGIYTDADVAEAACAAKADGFSAYDLLIAMSHTVPWMGLDTNDFNEAHDRIVQAAGLA